MATACSRGRGTAAAARSIAILYSQNAVMRTLGRMPIQFTMGLRHLQLNSRYVRREIGKLRDKTKISHIVRSMTVNHYSYHILPAYYSVFDYTDIEAI
jgi:hypothetical protein